MVETDEYELSIKSTNIEGHSALTIKGSDAQILNAIGNLMKVIPELTSIEVNDIVKVVSAGLALVEEQKNKNDNSDFIEQLLKKILD